VDSLWNLDSGLFYQLNVVYRYPIGDTFFLWMTRTGTIHLQLIAMAFGLFNPKSRYYVILFGAVSIVTELTRQPILTFVSRMRPSNWCFASPAINNFTWTSFPSGHASSTFCIAILVMLLTRRTKSWWMGLVFVFWAMLVSLSRVYLGVHYPTDVVAGACWGAIWASVGYIYFLPKIKPFLK
jgi:undecaprenyl-diphosphatase